jgi:hypothetical protein
VLFKSAAVYLLVQVKQIRSLLMPQPAQVRMAFISILCKQFVMLLTIEQQLMVVFKSGSILLALGP